MNETDELAALLRRRVADLDPGEDLWPRTLARGRRRLRRQRARRAGGALAAVLLVAGLGAAGGNQLRATRVDFGPASPVTLPATGADAWTPAFEAPIGGRTGHTATWTGDRMAVWGGWAPSAPDTPAFADGAALVPAQDGWLPIPAAPVAPRHDHAAVWTGRELVVWGGRAADGEPLADGAAYDPRTERWRRLPQAPLAGRAEHALVWTGSEAIVWGGVGGDGALADGAAYDPVTGTWRALPVAPLAARSTPLAVWTGAALLVVGGVDGDLAGLPVDGAAYDPATDRWRPLPDAPSPGMAGAAAAWTGDRLLVVGGDGVVGGARTTTNQALAYDPGTDAWEELAHPPLGPTARAAAVWTGEWLVLWGGGTQDHARTDGAAFDPVSGRWLPLPAAPLDGRGGATAVWAGDRMVVWGGSEVQVTGGQLGDGAAYTPARVGEVRDRLTAGAELRTVVADVDHDAATATVVEPSGREVVAGGPDRPVVAAAPRPASGPWPGVLVVVGPPGGYRFEFVGGPTGNPAPRPVEVALPDGLVTPPVPRFSPDGRTLAWIEVSAPGEAVLAHAVWRDSSEQMGPVERVPLEVPELSPDLGPGAGVLIALASWSQTDLAGGGAAMRLQLFDDVPGQRAGHGTPYGLLLERAPDGTIAVPDPRLRPAGG